MLYTKPVAKTKLVHLLSNPESDRERLSIASLSPLQNNGIEYIKSINERYLGKVPIETCLYPELTSDHVDYGITDPSKRIGPGTWGCFQSHIGALEHFTPELDFLLVCECDCYLTVAASQFMKYLGWIQSNMTNMGLECVLIGGDGINGVVKNSLQINESCWNAHCVLYNRLGVERVRNCKDKWFCFDIWLSRCFGRRIATTTKKIAVQLEGKSLVDGNYRGKKDGRATFSVPSVGQQPPLPS